MKRHLLWTLTLAGFIFLVSAISPLASDLQHKKSAHIADWREGDILFQSLDSKQCEAVKLATGSEWSHCGIILRHDDRLCVLEAIQPVQWAEINDWIERGQGKYRVIRLKGTNVLSSEALARMRELGEDLIGKNYDLYFDWTDDEWYCSELVWKLYDRCAGIRPGEPRPMGRFDLSHPEVQAVMKARYGNDPPLDQPMISPGDIASSSLFEVVHDK